jgi:hypothetical protein
MPGPRPRGDHTLTPAERSAAYRARLKAEAEARGDAPIVRIRYRRPADRRSKPQRWADAVETLADLIDAYQVWRDILPPALADSDIAQRLDDVIELRDLVHQLAAADLPKGFGRD